MQAIAQSSLTGERAGPIGRYLETGPLPTMPMPTGAEDTPTVSAAHLARLIEAVAADRDREAFTVLFDYFAPRIKASNAS